MARSGGAPASASVIKSVQRGSGASSTSASQTATITISAVDPAKCSVTVSGDNIGITGGANGGNCYLAGFTATSVVIASGNSAQNAPTGYSWQVVEFV